MRRLLARLPVRSCKRRPDRRADGRVWHRPTPVSLYQPANLHLLRPTYLEPIILRPMADSGLGKMRANVKRFAACH
jgi:hypothetical protein